ncbi:MAG: hypothetical protein H0W85_03595 [Methylotenera sp.]|nr:hypothetical protein [Methylotenera sp.]
MQSKKSIFILWVIFFCYALCIALIFQKLLLPLIPSLNAKGGLLPNDVTYFDSVAKLLSDQIRSSGWGVWKLYPANGVPGIVGILGALYYLFGYDPALILPLNAAIHALSSVMIFLIIQQLTENKRAAVWSGLVVSTLFIIYPSALSWYGQIHKDTYSIAGILLILFVWVKTFNLGHDLQSKKQFVWLIFGNFLGILLILLVRPFLLKLLLVPAFVFLVTLWLRSNARSLFKQYSFYFFLSVIFSLILSTSSLSLLSKEGYIPNGEGYSNWEPSNDKLSNGKLSNGKLWEWENSALLPDVVENYIETAAKTRVGLIDYGVSLSAKSMIDTNKAPSNIYDVLRYLPRAFQISLLAPFPNTWFVEKGITRLVVAAEMSIYYLFIPGLFFLFVYNRKPAVFLTLFYATFFLLVYGFTQANLGTLYRYRYGYFFIVFALSGLGWALFLDKRGFLKKIELSFKTDHHLLQNFTKKINEQPVVARKKVINDSVSVMLFTFLLFLGFFIRDMMMAKSFGMGHLLDSFFIALLIPMFFVTVVCIPLGSAFIPIFSEFIQKEKDISQVNKLVASISGYSLTVLICICTVIFLCGSQILSGLYIVNKKTDVMQVLTLLNIGLFILFFSGFVIIGNAILTIKGNAIYSSVAQLIVPILSIAVIYILGNSLGVLPMMWAIVIGQFINLMLVESKLRKYQISLWPSLRKIDTGIAIAFFKQYLPLIGAAFFVAAATTASTILAIYLPEGAVSAFNLGNKVVLFLIGILGAGVSSVMLPYFSRLISSNKMLEAKHELSIFVLLGTLLSIPFTMIIFVWSYPIAYFIFSGGASMEGQVLLVSRVMQYAVIQIPFFICSILLLKFATASKQTVSVLAVALVGLIINVGASYILMQRIGVGGIALGSTISTIISTIAILLILFKSGYIFGFDLLVVSLNWLLFITLVITAHFHSYAGSLFISLTYLLLLIAYLKSIYIETQLVS